MHVPDAPARRRRRGEPVPSTGPRASRLAARCHATPGLAQLLTEELLTVRVTFRVHPGREVPALIAARMLAGVLPRAVPPDAVAALADDLVRLGEATVTDVDVRLWFLAWSLGDAGGTHHAASRST